MKAGMLLEAQRRGTFERIGSIYWKDIRKGREVKKYFKSVSEELEIQNELQDDIVKKFGENGSLGPTTGKWEEGLVELNKLYDQDIELPEAPVISEEHMATASGFTTFDFEVLEELGVMEPLE